MEKKINDRLNHLKSLLTDETRVKLTKNINLGLVQELTIRIDELKRLKQ